jgi:hypothetical protein
MQDNVIVWRSPQSPVWTCNSVPFAGIQVHKNWKARRVRLIAAHNLSWAESRVEFILQCDVRLSDTKRQPGKKVAQNLVEKDLAMKRAMDDNLDMRRALFNSVESASQNTG